MTSAKVLALRLCRAARRRSALARLRRQERRGEGEGGGCRDVRARSTAAPTRSTGIRGCRRTSRSRTSSTYTPVHRRKARRSVVVGYWESGLDEAYNEWKDQVEEAGFNVTFNENEDKDAEVAYEGSGRTGIIAARDRCNEDEVTYVRITSRPE